MDGRLPIAAIDSIVEESSTYIVTDDGRLVRLCQGLSPDNGDQVGDYIVINTDETLADAFTEGGVLNSSCVLEDCSMGGERAVADELMELGGGQFAVCDGNFEENLQGLGVSDADLGLAAVIEKKQGAAMSSVKKRVNKHKKMMGGKTNKSINYVNLVQIPNGPVLFVSEPSSGSIQGQVVAMATKTDLFPSCLPKKLAKRATCMPAAAPVTSPQNNGGGLLPSSSSTWPEEVEQTVGTSRLPDKSGKGFAEACLLSKSAIRIAPLLENSTQTVYVCEQCEENGERVQYNQFGTLARHYTRQHGKRLLKKATVICREEGCDYKSWKVEELRQHLNFAHGFQIQSRKMVFTSMSEFEQWKEAEQGQTLSHFIRSSGNQTIRKGKWIYSHFVCRRSGNYERKKVPTATSTKKLKAQGSLKINGHCTSAITIIYEKQANAIYCEYWPSHYGHGNSIEYQSLSRLEKEWIAQLLLRGWNSDEIVKTLRNGTIAGTTERMRRIVRQDVSNIFRSRCRADMERRDADDLKSVHYWIEEMKAKGDVLLYRPKQAVQESQGGSINQEFLLVFMDDQQAGLAKGLIRGSVVHLADLPIVVNDAYRLLALTTIHPNDRQAYLLAYALTDDSGSSVLRDLFTAVHAKVGRFRPEWILTQDLATVSSAWRSVVGESHCPAFVWPPWKVREELHDMVDKLVRHDSKRSVIEKCIGLLLSEQEPLKFSTFLHMFSAMLTTDSDLSLFGQNFEARYTSRAENWSAIGQVPECSRLAPLDKELELITHRARHVKRLDKCIYSLHYLSHHHPFDGVTEFVARTQEAIDADRLRSSIASNLRSLSESLSKTNDDDVKLLSRIDCSIADTVRFVADKVDTQVAIDRP